jgi:hypothetical protein
LHYPSNSPPARARVKARRARPLPVCLLFCAPFSPEPEKKAEAGQKCGVGVLCWFFFLSSPALSRPSSPCAPPYPPTPTAPFMLRLFPRRAPPTRPPTTHAPQKPKTRAKSGVRGAPPPQKHRISHLSQRMITPCFRVSFYLIHARIYYTDTTPQVKQKEIHMNDRCLLACFTQVVCCRRRVVVVKKKKVRGRGGLLFVAFLVGLGRFFLVVLRTTPPRPRARGCAAPAACPWA